MRLIDEAQMSGASITGLEQQEALSRLVGGRLTSVQFVLDYLILGFDEKGAFTSLVWPEIIDEDNSVKFGMATYRDKLCSLILQHVTNAAIGTNETIIIDFDNGVKIEIPLRAYQGSGERAILTGPKHFLFVF